MAKKGKKDGQKKANENAQKGEFNLDTIKINKNIIFALVLVVIGAIILFSLMSYISNVNKFTYKGINFEKTQQGTIVLYTAKIPVRDDSTNKVSYIGIDFRNDPRKLEDISVNIQAYLFKTSNVTYISYQNTNKTYEDGTLAGANLGRFLSTIGLNAKAAMSDKSFKNNTSLPYVTCNTNPNNTVITLYEGNKDLIAQTGENCYVLIYTDTDILRVTEKFELSILEKIMTGTGKA